MASTSRVPSFNISSTLDQVFEPLRTYPKSYNGRIVYKYLLNNREEGAIDRAVNVIKAFLKDNPELCPVFPTNSEMLLKEILVKNPYLTINGKAICLASERSASPEVPFYQDRYFSEATLREPVKCTQGHVLEKSFSEYWRNKIGDICPAGNHSIGNLNVDEELKGDIEGYLEQQECKEEERNLQFERQQIQSLKNNASICQLQQSNQVLQAQIYGLMALKQTDPYLLAGATTKVVVKMGGKRVILTVSKNVMQIWKKSLPKEVARQAGKKSGKAIAKKLPFVSLIIGLGLGVYRFSNGEHWRAGGEVFSGILACFPGYGTGASVTLDLCMGGYDVYESSNKKIETPEITFELQHAYALLGIKAKENEIKSEGNIEPTQEEVSHAYKELTRILHPDHASKLGNYTQECLTELTALVNNAKDFIFVERGWS